MTDLSRRFGTHLGLFLVAMMLILLSAPATAQGKPKPKAAAGEKTKRVEGLPPGATAGGTSAVDLRYWKVTLPINKRGERTGSGDAAEIDRPLGLSVPPYFVTRPGSVTFTAPTDGARTRGSRYPRSELREMSRGGGEFEWTTATGGRLSATLRVNELPSTDNKDQVAQVVIGQIHGPSDELCRLYYTARGELYFIDDRASGGGKNTVFKLLAADGSRPSIPLGTSFSYTISVDAKVLRVTVSSRGKTYAGIDPISDFWTGKSLYFKAGAYVQVSERASGAGTVGTGRASVTFTAISPPQHGAASKKRTR